jgi:hypothetical protein
MGKCLKNGAKDNPKKPKLKATVSKPKASPNETVTVNLHSPRQAGLRIVMASFHQAKVILEESAHLSMIIVNRYIYEILTRSIINCLLFEGPFS